MPIFILRVNDCIVKINNIDVSNVDRNTAIEAIRNCSGNALLVSICLFHNYFIYVCVPPPKNALGVLYSYMSGFY